MKRIDDLELGQPIRRRRVLSLLGFAGAAWASRAMQASAQTRPACVVRPQQTEGPYFVDTQLERSDLRSDPGSKVVQPGMPLRLSFQVSRLSADRCDPMRDVEVELWQCNAQGVYSGVRDPHFDTTGQRFLRGYRITDGKGIARFLTIYPGWYPGRTVHIHFMLRTGAPDSRREEFTSQLYFEDALSDNVFSRPPYAARGPRPVRNSQDGIYRRGGSRLMLPISEQDGELAGVFAIGMVDG
jgi:protocatechuate 3,4-dioxygenase beta subunit